MIPAILQAEPLGPDGAPPDWLDTLTAFLPALATLVVIAALLWIVDQVSRRRAARAGGEAEFSRQLTMLGLTLVGVLIAAIALPQGVRGDVLSLFGVAITAVIALASTTFVSNAMAGVMLRLMRNFVPGDFIRVEDDFGRVTERRLLHTEIQSEERDLVTLPNFYLITKTVKVVRRSGTIVTATVSIGYDEPHKKVCDALLRAVERAGLAEPFAHVMELGDFSVTYRAAGFLEDVRTLISSRSALRAAMLDALHEAGIEIVSPTIMIQRQQKWGERLVAESAPEEPAPAASATPESIMFDKAELAERITALKKERETMQSDIAELEQHVNSESPELRSRHERGLEFRRTRLERIDDEIESFEAQLKERE